MKSSSLTMKWLLYSPPSNLKGRKYKITMSSFYVITDHAKVVSVKKSFLELANPLISVFFSDKVAEMLISCSVLAMTCCWFPSAPAVASFLHSCCSRTGAFAVADVLAPSNVTCPIGIPPSLLSFLLVLTSLLFWLPYSCWRPYYSWRSYRTAPGVPAIAGAPF